MDAQVLTIIRTERIDRELKLYRLHAIGEDLFNERTHLELRIDLNADELRRLNRGETLHFPELFCEKTDFYIKRHDDKIACVELSREWKGGDVYDKNDDYYSNRIR